MESKEETQQNTKKIKTEIDLNSLENEQLQYIPEVLIKERPELVVGIDEAGRGPILGAMVYGCCFCPVSETKKALAEMKFNDSKKLSERDRDNLFEKMRNHSCIGWLADSLEPESLSEKMLRVNKVSLNTISHESAIGMLRALEHKNLNIKQVFVDTVGIPSAYQAKLKALFPKYEITVAKKADSKYPIVGGASIVAKVIRDYRLRNWVYKENFGHTKPDKNFGSGYPSDPDTQLWLKRNIDPIFGSPSLVRFSWRPSIEILAKTAVDVRWSMDEEDNTEDREQRQRRLAISRIKDRGLRYRYFAENNMELVEADTL